MRAFQTEGIVLRHIAYRERDRMVSLLSPEYGRIDAAAYGSRKPGGRLAAGTEWFARGQYLIRTQGNRLQIDQCQLLESHYDLRTRFDRLTHASYICQLLEEAAQPQEPAPELYGVLRAALAHLAYGDAPPDAVTAASLARICAAMGYAPIVEVCASCGGPLHAQGARWDGLRGGATCKNCARPGLPPLFRGALDFLAAALAEGWTEIPEADAKTLREARGAMQEFLIDRLERKPKSLPMLDG